MNVGACLGVSIIVIAGVAGAVVGAQQSAENRAAAARQSFEPAPVPVDPYALLEAHAPGATLTWSDDPTLNCGGYGGGCFWPDHPNTIVVSSGVSPDRLVYVVLHEAAHLVQYRTGSPLDECAADEQAVTWGVSPEITYYLPTCPIEEKEG